VSVPKAASWIAETGAHTDVYPTHFSSAKILTGKILKKVLSGPVRKLGLQIPRCSKCALVLWSHLVLAIRALIAAILSGWRVLGESTHFARDLASNQLNRVKKCCARLPNGLPSRSLICSPIANGYARTVSCCLGIALLILAGRLSIVEFRSESAPYWPSTKGTLISAVVLPEHSRSGIHYYPLLSYSYNIKGTEYTGSHLDLLGSRWRLEPLVNDIRRIAGLDASDAVPLDKEINIRGRTVDVYYDPSDPIISVLNNAPPSVLERTWNGACIACCLIMGAFFIRTGIQLRLLDQAEKESR
jgi:hypothetical protein